MKLSHQQLEGIRFVLGDIDKKIEELRAHMEKYTVMSNHSFFHQLPARYQDYARLAYKREGMLNILLRLDLMKEVTGRDSALEQMARAGT